jgi:hypothetical protein
MWGMRRSLGPEEQSPHSRSKGRMRHVTKYPFLEDCGNTKQSEWSSVTFWSWPCIPGEASRLLLLCEEKRIDFARWEPFRSWPTPNLPVCVGYVRSRSSIESPRAASRPTRPDCAPASIAQEPARKRGFVVRLQCESPCPVLPEEIFGLLFFRNYGLIRVSRPNEGALRDRHGRRVRDAVGASGRSMVSMPTNDPDATVKSRGSGIPVLMPSRRMTNSLATGARQPVPGESAYKP